MCDFICHQETDDSTLESTQLPNKTQKIYIYTVSFDINPLPSL